MDFFSKVTLLSGLAVLASQQILKLKLIPLSFANKYPVPTNIVLSIGAVIIASMSDFVAPHSAGDWIGLVAVVSVTAGIVYNQVIGKWTELKSTEGNGTK